MMRKWRQLKRDTPIRFFFHQKTFTKNFHQKLSPKHFHHKLSPKNFHHKLSPKNFHQKTFIKTEAQHPNHVHPHSPLVWLSTKKRRLKVSPESFDFKKMFKSSPTTLEGRSPQDCPTPECSRWLCCLEIGAWRNGGGWRTYAICNMQYAICNIQCAIYICKSMCICVCCPVGPTNCCWMECRRLRNISFLGCWGGGGNQSFGNLTQFWWSWRRRWKWQRSWQE